MVQADLRDLDTIFEAAPTRELIDFSRPVGLFMLLVLHFVPDEWDPAAIVGEYRDRLAPGSFLALSHASAEAKPAGMDEAVQTYNVRSSQNQAFPRTHDEVLAFFGGFDLVEPGLVGCPSWRPDGDGDFAANREINEVPFAGVAVKP